MAWSRIKTIGIVSILLSDSASTRLYYIASPKKKYHGEIHIGASEMGIYKTTRTVLYCMGAIVVTGCVGFTLNAYFLKLLKVRQYYYYIEIRNIIIIRFFRDFHTWPLGRPVGSCKLANCTKQCIAKPSTKFAGCAVLCARKLYSTHYIKYKCKYYHIRIVWRDWRRRLAYWEPIRRILNVENAP